MASTTRIMNLIETPISITHGGAPLKKISGSIVFDNVSFAYDPQHQILKNFSVEIPKGKTVAFVGTTGAGKTTLLKLLFRFYDPDEGAILIDGKKIDSLDMGDLRRAMGLVSQDVFLFHGSVEENIAYPERNVSLKSIQEASKLAEADEFISHLPQGYATIVGERGQKLSGGQRQRLAIAREIIKNPPILIFDEATSSVDNETEMAIQKSIERITVGRTVILIAHRLSTVRNADTIHVLKHGKIVESGRHEALLEQEGIYAALWRLQTGQHFDETCLTNQT